MGSTLTCSRRGRARRASRRPRPRGSSPCPPARPRGRRPWRPRRSPGSSGRVEAHHTLGLLLDLDEAELAVVEDDILTGRFSCTHVSRSPISIAKPPSPASVITCRSGWAFLIPIDEPRPLAMVPCRRLANVRRFPLERMWRIIQTAAVPSSAQNTASSAARRSSTVATNLPGIFWSGPGLAAAAAWCSETLR